MSVADARWFRLHGSKIVHAAAVVHGSLSVTFHCGLNSQSAIYDPKDEPHCRKCDKELARLALEQPQLPAPVYALLDDDAIDSIADYLERDPLHLVVGMTNMQYDDAQRLLAHARLANARIAALEAALLPDVDAIAEAFKQYDEEVYNARHVLDARILAAAYEFGRDRTLWKVDHPGTQRTPQYLWDRASAADTQARADHEATVLAARKALLVAMGMVAA